MPSKTIAGRNVVVECAPAAHANAVWLLDVIPKLVEKGLRVEEGGTFQLGWAPLTLHERGGDLVVCEPDYEDLSRPDRFDVTTTLTVQADLLGVAHTAGVPPLVPTYRQIVFVDVGAWRSPAVTMSRIRLMTPNDTGWLVVPEGMDSSHTETFLMHQLVAKRRAWVRPMALPRAFTVQIAGEKITSIVKPGRRSQFE